MNSRQRRNKWLRTFVEGEFYYFNGQYMVKYSPFSGNIIPSIHFKKGDIVLVKCVALYYDDYRNFFEGQVILGNHYYQQGDYYMFEKKQFYRMQKPIEDET